jgi:hypothetical protein
MQMIRYIMHDDLPNQIFSKLERRGRPHSRLNPMMFHICMEMMLA